MIVPGEAVAPHNSLAGANEALIIEFAAGVSREDLNDFGGRVARHRMADSSRDNVRTILQNVFRPSESGSAIN
jgi:hypothetical protein